ncbi:hypothetical protein H4F99_10500 [Lysobacter sp. SG-8]|uniref:DUF3558 domain-containing protein n=1 Tax=Marilutibacter penaei TaxID=2759900 RepID=A0A7W3YF38_9GAMM|nr:hypothetical protein [Lysobacter penaei]MBB1088920.1 hypothetical protein [Lysobacter penaei]
MSFRVAAQMPWRGIALLAALFATACALPTPQDTAEVDDECDDNPIAAAFPDTPAIATEPLLWMQCSAVEVSARYGQEDPDTGEGEHCTISIHDTGASLPDDILGMGTDEMVLHAREGMLAFAHFNVDALVEYRAYTLQDPVLLHEYGGPDHLPVVGKTRTGDDYGITVPLRDEEPAPQALISVIRDRHVLEIECTHPVANHDEARDLYAPYLGVLSLGALP